LISSLKNTRAKHIPRAFVVYAVLLDRAIKTIMILETRLGIQGKIDRSNGMIAG